MNYAMFNYYGYIVGLVLCGVYTVMICYKSKDEHIADHFTDQRRGSLTNFAFLNYFFGAEKAGIGRYDNILNQF